MFGLSSIKRPEKKASVNSKIPRKGVVSRGILHLTSDLCVNEVPPSHNQTSKFKYCN